MADLILNSINSPTNDLPPEIFKLICNYLKPDDLKNLALTSKAQMQKFDSSLRKEIQVNSEHITNRKVENKNLYDDIMKIWSNPDMKDYIEQKLLLSKISEDEDEYEDEDDYRVKFKLNNVTEFHLLYEVFNINGKNTDGPDTQLSDKETFTSLYSKLTKLLKTLNALTYIKTHLQQFITDDKAKLLTPEDLKENFGQELVIDRICENLEKAYYFNYVIKEQSDDNFIDGNRSNIENLETLSCTSLLFKNWGIGASSEKIRLLRNLKSLNFEKKSFECNDTIYLKTLKRLFPLLSTSPNLEELNLKNQQKIETLPTSIGQLTSLKRIELRGCGIKELPRDILKLLHLEYMSINLSALAPALENSSTEESLKAKILLDLLVELRTKRRETNSNFEIGLSYSGLSKQDKRDTLKPILKLLYPELTQAPTSEPSTL